MSNWDTVRKRIDEQQGESQSWKSKRKGLLEVITQAEKWELDPHYAEIATISNLTEIVSDARRATRRVDLDLLSQLFEWAANKTTGELRAMLRGDNRERISYLRPDDRSGPPITLYLSESQFERIKRLMAPYFIFEEKMK